MMWPLVRLFYGLRNFALFVRQFYKWQPPENMTVLHRLRWVCNRGKRDSLMRSFSLFSAYPPRII